MPGEPAPVEFRILGELDVAQAGKHLPLGSHQQQVVLLALLLEQGRAVTTDRIVDRLWGDQPPQAAVPTIQSYVSRLRRALPADQGLLETTAGGYRLRAAREQVDAFRFEDLAGVGRRALVAGNLTEADRTLTDALALWRGPCLPEFADHPVAQAAIDRFDGMRLLVIEDAMEVALSLGRHGSSIGTLEQLVAENPFRERMWALLVLALYRADRQADALAALRKVRGLLADQLGVDPGPALRRLERQVLSQDRLLDLTADRTQAAPAAQPAEGGPTRDQGSKRIPFVGRGRELVVTRRLVDEVVAGKGGAVVLSGEAGIGKSTLARQVAAAADEMGVALLWARCSAHPGAPALWPWLQILRSARDLFGIPPDPTFGVLTGLLAEDVAATTTAASAPGRFALGQAVVALFEQLTVDRPVLLVVDDVHWADPPSLELLQAVAEQLSTMRLLLMVTHRSGPASQPLAQTLAVLARRAGASTLDLGGLDEGAIRQLLAATGRAPDGYAGLLWDRTGGNPFLLHELIRASGQAHASSGESVIDTVVPPGVREVLRARLLELPAEALEQLGTAAVLGRECQLAVLADVGRLAPVQCATVLEPAIAAGIITPTGEGVSTLRFAHALVHETVIADLSSVRVARLHARCAQVLMDRYPTAADAAEPIAHHILAGSALVPSELAVPAVIRAADVALSRSAYEASDRLLAAATGLVADQPAASQRDALELRILLRRLRLRLLVRGFAVGDLPQLAERARVLSGGTEADVAELSEALAAAAITAVTVGDRVAADALIRQCKELAADSADLAVRHSAHQASARVAFNTGRVSLARAELTLCLDLIRRAEGSEAAPWLTRTDIATPTYFTIGLAAFTDWIAGDTTAAERHVEECLALAGRLDPPARQLARYFTAWIAAWNDDFDGAVRLLRASLDEPAQPQSPYYRYAAAGLSSWATACGGDPEAGLHDIDAALAGMLDTKALPWVAYAFALRAEILMLVGDVAGAKQAIADAVDRVATDFEEEPYIVEILRIQGQILAADPTTRVAAEAVLREGIRLGRTQGAEGFVRRLTDALTRLSVDGPAAAD